MTDKQIINQEEAIKMIKKLNEKLKNVDDYIVELRSNFYRIKQDLDRKEQECEKLKEQLEIAKQNYSYESEKREIYIQILAEIKEIAETYYILGSKDSPVAQILQKISECEGNNE